MIRQFPFVVLFVLLISACTTQKKEERENFVPGYEMKTFRLESVGGCSSDTSSCAFYEITYPVFTNLSTIVTDSITLSINRIMDNSNPETLGLPFDSLGREFIHDFEVFKKDFPESAMGWHFKGVADVDSLSNTIICMTTSTDYFTGGAHGGHGTYFINIDPATGKRITLNEKLKSGYQEPLRQAGEKIFKEKYQSDSLSNSSYQFEEGMFTLNNNYTFTDDGIKFVYNIYEIAPYVAGMQEITIPYEEIEEWLK